MAKNCQLDGTKLILLIFEKLDFVSNFWSRKCTKYVKFKEIFTFSGNFLKNVLQFYVFCAFPTQQKLIKNYVFQISIKPI